MNKPIKADTSVFGQIAIGALRTVGAAALGSSTMVRAKFKVVKIERATETTRGADEDGKPNYIPCHLVTITLVPVQEGNPDRENARLWRPFWEGQIKISTVNAHAAAEFQLDGEYYVDFTAS